MNKIIEKKLSGTTDPSVKEYEGEHRRLARKAASEGMVLLENRNGLLPIPAGSAVALYGCGAAEIIKGGIGSGDVNEREVVSIVKGMTDAGYKISDPDWIEDYERKYLAARVEWKDTINDKVKKGGMQIFEAYSCTPFIMPAGMIPEKTKADYAIYFLSRIAGEGADRSAVKGDYYISDEEKEVLAEICRIYPKVIVAVNTGGLVDLSFMDELKIGTLIYIMQPGMEAGNAFADVISGKVTPSGKLTDTWAYHYEDYPNSATFSHNNGNTDTERYEEGIYVGYRYFDSFHVQARYCFGYGLSYTSFYTETESVSVSGRGTENPMLTVCVRAKNAGNRFSGRETVQVYCSMPQKKFEKEYRRLVGFGKTDELAPGAEQSVIIRLPLYQLAAYYNGKAEWVMEEGMYGIWVGNCLDSSVLTSLISVDKKICFSVLHNICPLMQKLTELTRSQAARSAEYRKWTEEGSKKGLPVIELTTDDVKKTVVDYDAQPQISSEAAEMTGKLSDDQLISMAKGDPGRGQMSALGSAGITVPGAAGETSSAALKENIPSIVLADGPAGLRLERSYHVYNGEVIKKSFLESMEGVILSERKLEDPGEVHYQFATAIPIGTLLAQSFDPELATKIGEMIGREMEIFNVTLWLAPGMNIHRNPLCGRNFEYYSEDPLVAGTMAAAVTRGVQKNPGVGTTIKHFCCNNQEDNRMGMDAIVSERALREIYLKGFEIAVRSSQPMSIMTSYNMVNGVHSANNHDICTDVARKEWGFAGVIMTDWIATMAGSGCTAAGCMRAGNDLIMPGMDSDDDDIRSELTDGRLSKQDLCRSIAYLINIILQSNQYEGAKSYSEQFKAIEKYMYSEKE